MDNLHARKKSPGQRPGRTRRKGEQILRAASDLFLQRGYVVTSMDAIAEQANVSKATLYSHHKSKEELFSQIVRNFLDRYSPAIVEEAATDKDICATLLRMGRSIVELGLAADDVAALRMVIAEAARSPELGELYHEAGPMRLHLHLKNILKRAMDQGQLRRADPGDAAEHFIALVVSKLHLEALLCVRKAVGGRTRDSVVKRGVEVFYRAYGPAKLARGV